MSIRTPSRTRTGADPPGVGTCLALAGSDVEKLTIFVDRVPCEDPAYTAQVFATPDLTELGDDPLSTYQRGSVEDVIGSGCSEGTLDDFLDADAVETPFVQTTFFTPTDIQWQLGARWAYCVVAYGAEAVRPAPGVMQAAFSRTPAAAYRTCLLLEGLTKVPCSQLHDAEYTGVQLNYPPDPVAPANNLTFVAQVRDLCEEAGFRYVPPPRTQGIESNGIFPLGDGYDPNAGATIDCVILRSDGSPTQTSIRD